MLAGVGAGLYSSLADASVMRGKVGRFSPAMDTKAREARLAGWKDALGRVLA
jgi:glycerol kinase